MLFLPSATKERRCVVCDEITDVFYKLSQFPSTVIDDDMNILCRCVRVYDMPSKTERVDDALQVAQSPD